MMYYQVVFVSDMDLVRLLQRDDLVPYHNRATLSGCRKGLWTTNV